MKRFNPVRWSKIQVCGRRSNDKAASKSQAGLMKNSVRQWFLSIVIFFVALIPRATSLESGWSYDESFWVRSSAQFISAMKQLEFAKTNLAYHPGVTTMWFGGLSLWSGRQLPEEKKSLNVDNLATARIGVAVITSIAVVAIYLLLLQLFNQKIALLCAIFIILDPFYLAHSRIIHTDALLASFTVLSVLSFLVYIDKKKRSALILSGIYCGLSMLTKTSGAILFLYTLISLGFHFYLNIENHKRKLSNIARDTLKTFFAWSSASLATFLALWPAMWVVSIQVGEFPLLLSPFIFFAFLLTCYITTRNPSKGSYKQKVMLKYRSFTTYSIIIIFGLAFFLFGLYKSTYSLISSIKWALTTPHENPSYFMGQVVKDPGILFYPVVTAMRTTPLSFIFSLLSLILLSRSHNVNVTSATYGRGLSCPPDYSAKASGAFLPRFASWVKSERMNRTVLMLFLFVGIFTITMMLVAKKLDRYLLPIFPLLDILAAVTFFYVMRYAYEILRITSPTKRKWFAMKSPSPDLLGLWRKTLAIFLWLGCIIVFIFQPYQLFALHPYYLAYYNPLFGGAKAAVKILTVGRGEGMDKAAEYLNGKENAERLTVAGDPTSFLRPSDTLEIAPYFKGKTVSNPERADYIVLYISDIQNKTPLVNQYYPHQTPEHVVKINGINYVWIYRNRCSAAF